MLDSTKNITIQGNLGNFFNVENSSMLSLNNSSLISVHNYMPPFAAGASVASSSVGIIPVPIKTDRGDKGGNSPGIPTGLLFALIVVIALALGRKMKAKLKE